MLISCLTTSLEKFGLREEGLSAESHGFLDIAMVIFLGRCLLSRKAVHTLLWGTGPTCAP